MKIEWKKLNPSVQFGFAVTDSNADIYFLFWQVSVKWRVFSWDATEPKRVVVAGSRFQYMEWLIKANKNPKHYRFVQFTEDVAGLRNIEVTYVGNYEANECYNWLKNVLKRFIIREVYEHDYSN